MRLITVFILMFACLTVSAQKVWMHPNEGQWDARIEYKVDLEMGEMYIEKDGWTFNLSNVKDILSHHHHHDYTPEYDAPYQFHVITSKFVGSNGFSSANHSDSSDFYRNYIQGNDPQKWKSDVRSYSLVRLNDIYPGTDLLFDGNNGALKYTLELEPGADEEMIIIELEGQDSIYLDNQGRMIIANRFGSIIEDKPVAWNEVNGKRNYIPIKFNIVGNRLTFEFPEGFDPNSKLVIDPSLTFSTFTGSTADNWGMSATPDIDGNLFGGGVVFASGYPTTTGAYDDTFNGGTVDIGITKFTADGTALLYSTYLGGAAGSETPNSIVCSQSGDLYIFGITSSSDFPMAGTPFDNTFDGGPSLANSATNNLGFTSGADLIVARLNPNGSALLASTYVGGAGTDGLNTTNLKFNYGDQFRGEIILDDQNNVYVTSMTGSMDFPTVNAAQPAINGGQDAVVFKMNSSLSNMLWSTFLGGANLETGNSVQLSSTGDVFVAGGTTSNTMPFTIGNDLTYNGGPADGYVAKFNGTTGNLLAGTFMGLGEYDQTYFVQLDIDDKVYVLGQTESDWGITSGLYGIPNSGQFIRKYSNDLMSIEWTTMIGAGTGHVEISPTAFLVSDCYDIYLSGWGGQLNANASVSQAVNSTSNGFPVTSDAYQSTTNGSNFYIAVLDQDAAFLKYGTYMGGVASPYNHVDGGTSRFDKSGRIYHAVCGSCGNGVNNGFTTTPGAWSETSNSSNCNMACFKFELNAIEAVVSDPNPQVCLPDPVLFNNNSSNGNFFFWDFGDGTISTQENTQHVYPGPGDYTVTLVVSDTNGCFSPDSTVFEVHIGDFQASVQSISGAICPGDSYQLEAEGGAEYAWSPAEFLDDSTLYNPTATIFQTTDFTVIVSDSCGSDTITVTVPVYNDNTGISNDTSVCIGNSASLLATGGGTYTWSPATYLDNPTIANPVSTPDQQITYNVEITTPNGCISNESVTVDVYYDPPSPVIDDTLSVCEGMTGTITVSGADNYYWSPNVNISSLSGPQVQVTPTSNMYYHCEFVNACGSLSDSIFVAIVNAQIEAFSDTMICPGESVQLTATGGINYQWVPSGTPNNPQASSIVVSPSQLTTYQVYGTDENGCQGTDEVTVGLYPQPIIFASPDVYAIYGDEVQLSAWTSTGGPIVWSPSEHLSCVVCSDPLAIPNQNYTYYASYTDVNGCSDIDTVNIIYDPILFVPNTFTPDGNEFNQSFYATGKNILEFQMEIYNRWGELIYTIDSFDDFWDGTYNGLPCQDGTYTWKARITDLNEIPHIFVGHVNLLR